MRKPNQILPGILEALDKATGNSVVWSKDEHEASLRNPDPGNIFSDELTVELPKKESIETQEKSIVAEPKADLERGLPEPIEQPIVEEKKAVKKTTSSKKQKKTDKKDTTEVSDPVANISPFLKWLKSKPGSEYVHPYDENQESDPQILEQEEVISETLADLLASQGYKERAIAMYSRLMQKFPEKSRFFAAKIEGLQ